MRVTILNSRILTTVNLKFSQSKGKMTNREILLEMYEKLWNADKDKYAWNVILKDTLEKLETKDDTER